MQARTAAAPPRRITCPPHHVPTASTDATALLTLNSPSPQGRPRAGRQPRTRHCHRPLGARGPRGHAGRRRRQRRRAVLRRAHAGPRGRAHAAPSQFAGGRRDGRRIGVARLHSFGRECGVSALADGSLDANAGAAAPRVRYRRRWQDGSSLGACAPRGRFDIARARVRRCPQVPCLSLLLRCMHLSSLGPCQGVSVGSRWRAAHYAGAH